MEIGNKIGDISKIDSCFLPTPIERLNNISELYGKSVYIKRDDLTGHFFGGNKERKLEYIMADAMNENASVVVTVGSPSSNHNMITTGFANKLGLKTELIVIKKENMNNNEICNYNLCKKMGAIIHDVDVDEVKNKIKEVMKNLKEQGEKPYFIEGGGHNVFGTIGYINMVKELKKQIKKLDINPRSIALPVGTATTYAGIYMGCKIFDLDVEIIGISIARDKKRCIEEIENIIRKTEEYLELNEFTYDTKIKIHDEYIGEGYGIPSEEGEKTIKILAEKEGLVLDPIYNGKAMTGSLDLISKGKVEDPMIYLHTGGTTNIFSKLGDES